jgi:TRAP-type C4-dicarboxylate transport system permease small subunit
MILENSARSLERVANPLSRIADSVGRVILVLMVLLITLDVVLRYFLNRPIKGSYELVEFMLAMIVFLGLAYMQTKKGHVSINLLTNNLSSSQNSVIRSATYLLCLIIFSLISWRCMVQAEVLRTSGTSSDVLSIPNFPFMWVVVFGSILMVCPGRDIYPAAVDYTHLVPLAAV